ncbi:Krueppel homolog 2 [Hylaeus anthracinus]|uniref:Krueppel homolog 2 n=1 Tax=Hylaeus volcanicus TaxID=313075 RepID=UPI0023B78D4A|nr:Krueppel homolog 2 [Hylaeus volcanicus]XP_053975136.1 Krueppel homolog 2 [Hylaeus volcanicus]XP_053975137.1 Krueppel homolog 2 [Hylaeus volcanicus]XP_053975139.1 Krueppel homolog 2 [Hylaeus volcanicus]XP_053999744.1 Krueppel homolog 2 [Hylaeus anthracinus]XP_053999745.1 Krueppel homolog 2 [Hylaeus anthracinus]XP_053999746.1 Krueppel homolog 2 [Hylaeus anthracinus]XP_053999747.1 Krueppel homolog 2 [Hylaeus anthracinus]
MADTTSTGSGDSSPQVEKGWNALRQHIIDNKIKVGLWITRLFTIIFTIGYIIPIFGNPYNIYYKALMSSAATSALRLHQRVPRVQLNRPFLNLLFLEDSFHYLFYSLIFLYAAPVTLVLIPIFLFALMHFASYLLTLLDCLGQNSLWGARLSISIVEFQSRNILRLCALSEIIILPFTVLLVFTGRAGLLTPIIYYQFLKSRLESQRNPFTRNVFYELRNRLSSISRRQSLPEIVRRMIQGLLLLTQQMVPIRQ